jgi:hypothetical protein
MEVGQSLRARLRPLLKCTATVLRSGNKAIRVDQNSRSGDFVGKRLRQRRHPDKRERPCLVSDQTQLRYVQVARDEESGPLFYQVQVRHAETDAALSRPRQTTDLGSLRAMFTSFPAVSISARSMFGGTNSVTIPKAMDLLRDETGTRAVAKFNATRAELLASLGLLRLRS